MHTIDPTPTDPTPTDPAPTDPTPTIIIAEDARARVPGLFVESATADGLRVSKDAPYLDDAVGEILDRWNACTADDVAQVPGILLYRWGIEGISRERVRATLADCIELCRQEAIAHE